MERVAVFGDVHGNLPALDAVLKHAGDCDAWWCAGDVVGYGPFPNECVRSVEELGARAVTGNHDLGSIGKMDLEEFNAIARVACRWTGGVLDDSPREYLESLPATLSVSEAMVVHASPRDPVWEYVLTGETALSNFRAFSERICFIGHSHAPEFFTLDGEGKVDVALPTEGEEIRLEGENRYIFNVGSVGQPRDGDPRACYTVWRPGEGTVTYHRVEYPIEDVQRAILEAGLPEFLAVRLSLGR